MKQIEVENVESHNPLMEAVYIGHVSSTRVFLNRGADAYRDSETIENIFPTFLDLN